MLFMLLSSAFDTIILYKMTNKLYAPGLTTFKHDCILDTSFSHQPPSLRLGKHILTLSMIVPQGCVLTPFLCALFTFYSQYTTQMSFFKFANDATVIRHITDNNEDGFGEDVHNLTWQTVTRS